jgi:hypothetical protein
MFAQKAGWTLGTTAGLCGAEVSSGERDVGGPTFGCSGPACGGPLILGVSRLGVGGGASVEVIQTLDDIEANLRRLEAYLGSADPDEREFARSLVRRGRCFIFADRDGRPIFGPSRFVGYSHNSREAHAANDAKDGKRTNPAISALLGRPEAGDAELEGKYRLFGQQVGARYRDLAGMNIRRRYWRLG